MITIHLNGEAREVPEGLTLAELLGWLKLPADRVAVERNREIVPKSRWPETPVRSQDRLEVVHFVGGGQGDFRLSIFDCELSIFDCKFPTFVFRFSSFQFPISSFHFMPLP